MQFCKLANDINFAVCIPMGLCIVLSDDGP